MASLRTRLRDAKKDCSAIAHKDGNAGLAARVKELEEDLSRAKETLEAREVSAAAEVRRVKELSNRMVRSLREKQDEIEALQKQQQTVYAACARADRERMQQLHSIQNESRKDKERAEEALRGLKRYMEVMQLCKTCTVKVTGKVPLKKSDADGTQNDKSNAADNTNNDLMKKRLAAARSRAVELEGRMRCLPPFPLMATLCPSSHVMITATLRKVPATF